MLRNHLNSKERKDFVPLDVVHEPTLDDKKLIVCFYAPEIHLGFHTTIEKLKYGKRTVTHAKARQCHYCRSCFVKSYEKMKKHLPCCSGKAGFTFSFDNEKIIDYQDHYKNLGDVPFAVYYDFETTTGSVVFLTLKCM